MTEKNSTLAPLGNIDRRLIKHSAMRLVLAGEVVEVYRYERPYFYNKPPAKNTRGACSALANTPRRGDNLHRARQTIRRTIAANANAWGQKLKFITFTFKKNETDIEKANQAWVEFSRKMRNEFGPMRYLCVVEFQKRGAIHFHALYFNLPYVKNVKDRLAKLWGHGFVKLITIRHVKNVGAYVSKYLQQDILDLRLRKRKAFFTSRKLKKPQEYRNEQTIARILRSANIRYEVEKTYPSSSFGNITYSQGVLKSHHHDN